MLLLSYNSPIINKRLSINIWKELKENLFCDCLTIVSTRGHYLAWTLLTSSMHIPIVHNWLVNFNNINKNINNSFILLFLFSSLLQPPGSTVRWHVTTQSCQFPTHQIKSSRTFSSSSYPFQSKTWQITEVTSVPCRLENELYCCDWLEYVHTVPRSKESQFSFVKAMISWSKSKYFLLQHRERWYSTKWAKSALRYDKNGHHQILYSLLHIGHVLCILPSRSYQVMGSLWMVSGPFVHTEHWNW